MKLECPYCKGQLAKGFIGNFHNCSFRWYEEKLKFLEQLTAFGGEKLSTTIKLESYRCRDCNKIIIDLDEIE